MKNIVIIAIILVLTTAVGTFAALELHQTITIEIDGVEQSVTAWAWTVGDVLTAARIPVVEGDIISPSVEARLPDNGHVNIERAFWVTVTADGESNPLWTTERLPEKLLEIAEVQLGSHDVLLWNGLPIAADNLLPKAPFHSLQIRRAATIWMEEDTQKQQIISTGATLGDALWEQGIILNSQDNLNPSFESAIQGQSITADLQRSRVITIQLANSQKPDTGTCR